MAHLWDGYGIGLALLLGGCPGPGGSTGGSSDGNQTMAVADIRGTNGLSGRATFTEREGKVQVRVEVRGAPPGEHGLHVHEKGDCSDPEYKSAGGHFNPNNAPHGGPTTTPRHSGDFGNLTVQADGTGTLELETDLLTVRQGPTSVIGRAIIVHAQADDLITQPTGAAGGRIGCGVIGPAR